MCDSSTTVTVILYKFDDKKQATIIMKRQKRPQKKILLKWEEQVLKIVLRMTRPNQSVVTKKFIH